LIGSNIANGSSVNYSPGLPGTPGSLPATPGKYFIYAILNPLPFNPLCRPFQEWEVNILPIPKVDAGDDLEMIEGESVILNGRVEGNYTNVNWTPANSVMSPTTLISRATPDQTTLYTLTVISNEGCSEEDDVFVKVYNQLDMPNVFSPNGDGVHDKWVIRNIEQFPRNTMQIFDRNGKLILERFAYNSQNAWDGTLNSVSLPVGVYYYVLTLNDKRKPQAGTITILR
jgi:gliding motility-associated-like protein